MHCHIKISQPYCNIDIKPFDWKIEQYWLIDFVIYSEFYNKSHSVTKTEKIRDLGVILYNHLLRILLNPLVLPHLLRLSIHLICGPLRGLRE